MATKKYDKRTAKEKYHTSVMADAFRRMEHDILRAVIVADGLPKDWHAIAHEETTGARDKITMRLERDVIRFFKALGPNYQQKMARVLKAWMHGRLAKAVAGPDTTDIVLRPEEIEKQISMIPYWGEDGSIVGVTQFVEGVRFYQAMNMAREEGEEVPKGEAFEAAVLEAALKGSGLEG